MELLGTLLGRLHYYLSAPDVDPEERNEHIAFAEQLAPVAVTFNNCQYVYIYIYMLFYGIAPAAPPDKTYKTLKLPQKEQKRNFMAIIILSDDKKKCSTRNRLRSCIFACYNPYLHMKLHREHS